MAASLRRASLVHLRKVIQHHHPSISTIPHTSSRYYLNSISWFFSAAGPLKVDLSNEESKRQIVNRMLYRSKQRGYLELDLVLGNWVEEHIRTMDEAGIQALAVVLDLESPELWKWLTGQEEPPEGVGNNPVFSAVRSKVTKNLDSHSAQETRAMPGQPWVRGWDDKRGLEGPKYGNQ